MSDQKTGKQKWKNLGRILLGQGLPAVAATIGGPAGGVVGNVIADIFGADRNDVDEIEASLAAASPEQLVQLRQIEADIIAQELEVIRNEDDNLTARLQSDNSSESTLTRNIRPVVLLIMVVAYLALIFTTVAAEKDTAETALEFGDQIKFLLMGIVGFYFGSRGTEKVVKTLKR